jgi:metal-responsive CopG/Arc/MetJ family transcriptional regulator
MRKPYDIKRYQNISNMENAQVLLRVPRGLMEAVDSLVRAKGYSSRQGFIRESVREKVEREKAGVELVEMMDLLEKRARQKGLTKRELTNIVEQARGEVL